MSNVVHVDFVAPPWRHAMAASQRALDALGCPYTVRRDSIRIHLGSGRDLIFCPWSGEMKFEGGEIFSRYGLRKVLEIVRS
jgi:hypothetical protein